MDCTLERQLKTSIQGRKIIPIMMSLKNHLEILSISWKETSPAITTPDRQAQWECGFCLQVWEELYLEKLVFLPAQSKQHSVCQHFKSKINIYRCYNKNAQVFLMLWKPWIFALCINFEVSAKKISLSGTLLWRHLFWAGRTLMKTSHKVLLTKPSPTLLALFLKSHLNHHFI